MDSKEVSQISSSTTKQEAEKDHPEIIPESDITDMINSMKTSHRVDYQKLLSII